MLSSDGSLLVCVLALATAIGAYGVASLVQAKAARRNPDSSVTRLLVEPLVLAGLGLDVVGFLGTAVALHALPLFFVQGAASASIVVTALLVSIFLKERPSRREAAVMPLVLLGLSMLAVSAEPGPAEALPLPLLAALAVGAPAVAAGGLWLPKRPSKLAGAGLAVLAGLSYGSAGLAARGLSASDSSRSWLIPTLLLVAIHAVQGVVLVTVSMRKAAVNSVTSVLFATETLMPSAIGWALLGDRATPGMGWSALIGCAVLLLSTAALSHGPAHAPAPPTRPALQAVPEPPHIPLPRLAPDAMVGAHRAGRHRR
jgi:drug/metabolite transporter (DMT)-like permease